MKVLICLLGIVSGFVWVIVSADARQCFSDKCAGHLLLAAQSTSAKYAHNEIVVAWKYIQDNNLNIDANTGILFNKYPENDLQQWAQRIEDAKDNLERHLDGWGDSTEAELLRTIRQCLVSDGMYGPTVNTPSWIYFYPNQRGYLVWLVVSICAILVICFGSENKSQNSKSKKGSFLTKLGGRKAE